MNGDNLFAFPLSIQLPMPEDLHGQEFHSVLALLKDNGFSGIELNIVDFEKYAPGEYTRLLGDYGLRLNMIASGGYAKRMGLSLSSRDPAVRGRTTDELRKILDFAAETGSGVICGFLKGPPGGERDRAVHHFLESLVSLDPWIRERKVPFLIEATNRYEASVATSLQEAAALCNQFKNPWLSILPDTYHMNIEEADMNHALLACRKYYQSVHISDNNRCFPGFGSIDFFTVLACLQGIGYRGGIAIEGNICGSFEGSIALSTEYLRSISKRLALLRQTMPPDRYR